VANVIKNLNINGANKKKTKNGGRGWLGGLLGAQSTRFHGRN